ncbi:sugar ABC transporter permease, partial [Nonomuraea sp. NPDC050643]|uniref:carbohydrate ABC transporter permease n=1 Tax=Nonomuraea sp. NPDC050643 TaxID=3155660 RepID=UPI0033F64440
MTSPTPPQAFSPALGWLLAAPALLGTLISLVLPTVQTIWLSFQSGGILKESAFVGTANYTDLLGESGFWRALGFTFSLTLIPLLVALVVGPLLALALDRAGTWARRAGRIVLSLAVVTFSPVAVAGAWMRWVMPDASGITTLAEGLREPATAPGTLRLIVGAATFGVVCALAVMAFLPVLRGGTVVPAMLAVGALVALATVAVGLQTFSIGMVLTRGGPERSTETLAGLQYDYAFRMAEFGPGASVAALTGVILGALGIVATVVAVLARLRITLTPRATSTAPATAPATAATGPWPAGQIGRAG